jgi:alpha-glucosidase
MTDNDQFSLAYAAMGDRLRLSRYLYTQMYLAHTQGGALVQPLFYLYPRDDRCFEADVINSTYMLGPAVKVTPTLENKADGADFQAYFPQGKWVNLYQPQSVIDGNATAKIIVDSSQPNIHQKSGTIIPWLNNNKALRTTRDVEQQLRTGFRIVRDPSTLAAEGDLMIDDGITPNLYSPAYMDTYQHTVFDKNFTHYVIRMSSAKTINFMV